MNEVIVRVTTPTYHAHEPLGMQILARTLVLKEHVIDDMLMQWSPSEQHFRQNLQSKRYLGMVTPMATC